MTPILQALGQGHNPQQILKYITRFFPKIAPQITKAVASGYSIDQIVKYLNRALESESNGKFSTPHEIEATRKLKQNDLVKKVLGTAATIGGTALAARGVGNIARGLIGNVTAPGSPQNIAPSPMQNAPVQPNNPVTVNNAPIPSNPLAALPNQSVQSQLPINPQSVQNQPVNSGITQQTLRTEKTPSFDLIKEFGLEKKVKDFIQSGNTDEGVAAVIQVGLTPEQKANISSKIKKGEIISIEDSVKRYREANKPIEKPVKGNLVATPHGMGELESIREKEALINHDGKLHKVKTEDLITSPIPEKDLASLYQDVIQGIEKETGEQVSRNVNWAGYDPNTNTLAYLPHDGSLYLYEDISPEEKDQLTNILNVRKTSGENFIGAWKEGSKSPIGSSMYQLIKKLQSERGGKGNEYSGKFQTVYSALEPAIKAAKKKKK